MKLNFRFLYLLFILFIPVAFLPTGCANIAAPTGGYKDTIPPLLVSVSPKDSATNFNTKKIVLEFNEYVEVKDIQQNVIVSPLPKLNPEITYKLRTVTVKIKDTLEANTTYSINFGNAIKDNNEGNPLKNYTYVFSTGNKIDDYTLTGKVIVAQTGLIDSTLIVMLHQKLDDSAVVNARPRYFTRVDNKGNFKFNHLPPGIFAIYALQDEGGQFRYQGKAQLFAFADKPLTITDKNEAVNLYAYIEKEEKKEPVKSLINTRPQVREKSKEESKDKRLPYTVSLDNGQQDLLSDLVFTFPSALKTVDSTKFSFTDDLYKPITAYTLLADTSNKKLTLQHKWVAGKNYNIIIQKGWATDSTGKTTVKLDTLKFKTNKESDYGSVRIRILNIDLTKNPVLQLLQGTDIKYTYRFTSKEFKAKLFKPGEYVVRILFDDNKNGVWDAGKFFGKHIQPEKVQPITKKLTIKVNWDNEMDITL